MNITINPFQQLYFSDDTQSEGNFVELFSDKVLQTAIHPVFQGGNVVLSGTQGCGKTMILNLLRPEIRLAYHNAGKDFPIPPEIRNFVSAGINITRSGITDIGQVTLGYGDEHDLEELPFYFADFFNYWIIKDLIESVQTIGANPEVFNSIVDLSNIEAFVEEIVVEDCWFGALTGISSLHELKQSVKERVVLYRFWTNGNSPDGRPNEAIRSTKTNIGEPIARVAEALRRTGTLKRDVPVLIRVDQVEELHRAFTERQQDRLYSFRRMLNKAFSMRDARIHYRAGSRRYGFNNPRFMRVWGTDAPLENRRDYNLIDMDQELFALGETKNSIFPRFAADAFRKRVAYYLKNDVHDVALDRDLAKSMFGKSPTAMERLSQLALKVSNTQIDRALALNVSSDREHWTTEWKDFLRDLYRHDHEGMLNAVLAAAWGRQTGGSNIKIQHRDVSPPENEPWKSRKWWRKERLDQAVLQLSTRSQQRFNWWGFDDVVSLSGGNISVFIHICHRVWDGFLKNESSLAPEKRTDLFQKGIIPKNIQSAGILFASNEWFKKLPEEAGGNARQNFIEHLGTLLNSEMMNDLAMSYPGGNGVSVPLSQYNPDSDWIEGKTISVEDENTWLLQNFIQEAVGYGALFESEHSSKSKKGGKRIKFYLNPILCPRFQIPEARTKEPRYWTVDKLLKLVGQAKVTLRQGRRTRQIPKIDEPLLPGFED